MIESKTKLSIVLRFSGLLMLGPLALAGCAGGGHSDSASLGLASGGAHRVHVPGTFAPTSGRATGRIVSHSRPMATPHISVAKKRNAKPVKMARVSEPIKIHRTIVSKRAKRAVVKQAVVKNQPVIHKTAKVLPQMKPIKADSVKLASTKLVSPQLRKKTLGRLEPALLAKKSVARIKAKPVMRDKPAPVTFEFGQSAHRFSARP